MNVSLQLIFQNYGGALADAEHVACETERRAAGGAARLRQGLRRRASLHRLRGVSRQRAVPLVAGGEDAPREARHGRVHPAVEHAAARGGEDRAARPSLGRARGARARPRPRAPRVRRLRRRHAGVARPLRRGGAHDPRRDRSRLDRGRRSVLSAGAHARSGRGRCAASATASTRSACRPSRSSRRRGIGARLAIFSQMPWEMWAETSLARVSDGVAARRTAGTPPPPLTCDLMYCAPTDAEAEETARVHMAEYYLSVLDHYELLTEELQRRARLRDVRAGERDPLVDRQGGSGAGLPARCRAGARRRRILEKLRARGGRSSASSSSSVIARYGAMPREKAKASMELFGREVLPELRRW